MQETFLRACAGFQSMVQYDSAEAWLVRVCHHVAVDEARFLMRTRKLLDNLPEQAGHGGASGLQELLPADFPEEYADLLIRYYRDRNTTVELARDMGLAPTAVRKRLSRARQRLRSMPPEAILAELDRWVQAEEQASREPDADVISACYEVLDEVDPVPVPDRAYETSRALFAQEHPEYMEPAPAAPPGGKRRFRPRGRRLSLAAAIALLIVGGTVAFAFELPQRLLVSMGFETFLVGDTRDEMRLDTPTEEGYYTLEDALADYGVRTYTPTWMPEDMKLTNIIVAPDSRWSSFIAAYSSTSPDCADEAFIRIVAYDEAEYVPVNIYEDDGERISSAHSDLQFLVTSNLGMSRILWQSGSYVGNVWGPFSEAQVSEIINSIRMEDPD